MNISFPFTFLIKKKMIPPYTYFGYIGSSILAILLWPQVYTTYKTKNVEGLSGIFLSLNIIATAFWILYGIGFILSEDISNGIIIIYLVNCLSPQNRVNHVNRSIPSISQTCIIIFSRIFCYCRMRNSNSRKIPRGYTTS